MNFIRLPTDIRLIVIKELTSEELRSLLLTSRQLLEAYTSCVEIKKIVSRKMEEYLAWAEIIDKIALYVGGAVYKVDTTPENMFMEFQLATVKEMFLQELDPCFIIDILSKMDRELICKIIYMSTNKTLKFSSRDILENRELACILYGVDQTRQIKQYVGYSDIKRYCTWMKDRQVRRRWRLIFDVGLSEQEKEWKNMIAECVGNSKMLNGLILESLQELIPETLQKLEEHVTLSDIFNFKTHEDICSIVMETMKQDEFKWLYYVSKLSISSKFDLWPRYIAKVKNSALRKRFMMEVDTSKSFEPDNPLVQEIRITYITEQADYLSKNTDTIVVGESFYSSHYTKNELLKFYNMEYYSSCL